MGNFNQDTLKYAQQNVGTQVWASDSNGNKLKGAFGECWDLGYEALRYAGAKKTSATYVWGQLVTFSSAQPGDIIQFSKFKIDVWFSRKDVKGAIITKPTLIITEERGQPKHTAIIKSRNAATGEVELYEQNWISPTIKLNSTFLIKAVIKNTLPGGGTEERETKVSGSFLIYRPS